jgi:hypothetical protein
MRWGRVTGIAPVLFAFVLTATAAESASDEFGCPSDVAAYRGLTFVNAIHERWYHRFWTGTCEGLPVFSCFSGRPFWGDTMSKILHKVVADRRPVFTVKLCTLGRRVGYEWAKENNIRTIDTKLVVGWTQRLESALEPESEVDAIRAEVDQRLTGK